MVVIIIRPAELFLKGQNRRQFEQQLIRNTSTLLLPIIINRVTFINSIILLELVGSDEANKITLLLASHLIGAANISHGYIVTRTVEAVWTSVAQLEKLQKANNSHIKTFRVSVHRHHKIGFYTSIELERIIGAKIVSNMQKKVNLTKYDLEIRIEVFQKFIFVCENTIRGLGGLPVSSSGKTLHLISAGFDSPVASFFLQKRGLAADYLHFYIENEDTDQAIAKVKAQIVNLKLYQQRTQVTLFLVGVKLLFTEIVCSAQQKYQLLILKHFFILIATSLKTKYRYDCISTGESLGQVSTQTITNLNFLYSNYRGLPITPLIGMSKLEIMAVARKIGSHAITLQKGTDLCGHFARKHQAPAITNHTKFEETLANSIYMKIVREILKNNVSKTQI